MGMSNSVAVKCVWITVLETKILCLSTDVLQFSCAALQKCSSPNLKGKTPEELKGAVCVCLIIICIPSETVSKAAHKYHHWYLRLFNLCSYSLHRKQDHWTYSSVTKEHSVIAIIRTVATSFKANLAIWQEAVMEESTDFGSTQVQSVHMAAAWTGCLIRVFPF